MNDKWDAAVMCRRLSEYLDGHCKALSIVHIPSPKEEEERAAARFREQLCKELRRIGAKGRGLLLQREMAMRGRWWRGKSWQRITQEVPLWVVHQLEIWKELIEKLEKRISQAEKQLRCSAAGERVLFGEGELTHVVLKRELLNMERFKNARQVGNYFGLWITKHGNPRLRRLMVEMAWRIVRLAAALRRLAALGTSAVGREQRRRTQKSDRKRSAAAGDRSMAHRHWAQTTRRARAAAQQRSLNRKEGNLI